MRSMVEELRSHMLRGKLNWRVRVQALQQKIPHDAAQLSSVATQLSHAAAKSPCSQINIFSNIRKKQRVLICMWAPVSLSLGTRLTSTNCPRNSRGAQVTPVGLSDPEDISYSETLSMKSKSSNTSRSSWFFQECSKPETILCE